MTTSEQEDRLLDDEREFIDQMWFETHEVELDPEFIQWLDEMESTDAATKISPTSERPTTPAIQHAMQA